MMKRFAAAVGLLIVLALSTLSASATCIPGRIEVDPKTGKVTIELPRCNPPQRAA